MSYPGKLIVFEGPEGTGKTTQAALLEQNLVAAGHQVVLSKEPGKVFDGKLRDIILNTHGKPVPVAELFLFLADRAQHVATIVRPALEAGKVVILDRFTDSTVAYQWFGKDFLQNPIRKAFDNDLGAFMALLDMAADYLKPDVIVYLEVPREQAAERLYSRSQVRRLAEQQGPEFEENLRTYFDTCLGNLTKSNLVRTSGIDEQEDVAERVFERVRARL